MARSERHVGRACRRPCSAWPAARASRRSRAAPRLPSALLLSGAGLWLAAVQHPSLLGRAQVVPDGEDRATPEVAQPAATPSVAEPQPEGSHLGAGLEDLEKHAAYAPGADEEPSQSAELTDVSDEVRDSLAAALTGFVIFLLGFPVLWGNEQRALHMVRLFRRAQRVVVQRVSATRLNPVNQSRLVHVQGMVNTKETLVDSVFGIQVQETLKLRRKVEMFQWSEHAATTVLDRPGGGKEKVTTYSYQAGWHSVPVESWRFQGHQGRRHTNPPMPFIAEEKRGQEVTLGSYRLPMALLNRLSNYVPCTELAPKTLQVASTYGGQSFTQAMVEGTLCLLSRSASAPPEIGDLRVSFERVPAGEATVLAVQAGETFVPMKWTDRVSASGRVALAGNDMGEPDPELARCSCCCLPCGCISKAVTSGKEVFQIAPGKKSARQMLRAVERERSRSHCIMKFAGFLCIIGGMGLTGSVLPALFRIIPFAGPWIESFGWLAVWAIAIIFGSALGHVAVALAWLRARPLKALMLLLLAGGVAVGPWLCIYWRAAQAASPVTAA